MAKTRDQELKEAVLSGTMHLLGPLHGIPISIKDNIMQSGHTASVGVASLCNQIFSEDAVIVKLLVKAGAVPMVRGNLPQSALSIHSMNYVWGEARNPRDTKRSCGGSSGGDAGLIASRCVPFAVGTDIHKIKNY